MTNLLVRVDKVAVADGIVELEVLLARLEAEKLYACV